jgi:hypothetical protein
VGSTIVCAHTERAPSDEEWAAVIACIQPIQDPHTIRILVHTDGGAPTATQRALLNSRVGTAKPPLAVMTPSSIARAAATAISWFSPSTRVFRPEDIAGAIRHLAVPQESVAVLRRTLAELRTDLRTAPSEGASLR